MQRMPLTQIHMHKLSAVGPCIGRAGVAGMTPQEMLKFRGANANTLQSPALDDQGLSVMLVKRVKSGQQAT